jgi:tetratricopeptide (TPR) repeat protein
MSQWFHLYEIDDETFQLVVRTFASVFPHVTVWESMSADVLLLGSERPLAGDPASLRAVMDKPAVAAEFARIGISDPLTLLSLQIMSNRNVRAYSGDGLLNTEDRLALEYLAPRAFFVNRGVMGLDDIDERFRHPSPDTYLMRAVSEDPLTDGQKRTLGLFHSRYQRGHPLLGFFLLEDYITRHPADEEVLVSLIGVTSGLSKPEARVAYLGKLAQARPEDPRTLAEYGWALFELGQKSGSALGTVSVEAAVTSIRHAISLSGDTVDAYRVRLADMFYATGRFALAMDQYARALEIREIHEPDPYIPQDQLLTRLALCLYETGQRSRALGYALQAVNFNPANEQARSLIVSLWNEGTETSSEESGQP